MPVGTNGNDTLTGTSGSDILEGLGGDDILDGLGGADTMRGGLGDDYYYVDNAGDTAIEAAGEGTDTVESTVSFTLGSHVENLTLSGANAINGTGNSLANILIGNGAANILDGSFGADTMQGGGGHDTYIVDNAGDVITELAGGGTDTIQSSLSYILGAELALHRVGTGTAVEQVGCAIAEQGVDKAVAGAVDRTRAGENELLDIGAEREADRTGHLVHAAPGAGLDHLVEDIVDDIAVVPQPALHGVGAYAAIEDVGGTIAG